MRVPRIVFAEVGLHLSDLRREVIRQRDEIGVTLLHVNALRRKRQEKIRFRIGIDERLERHFRFVKLERWAHVGAPELIWIHLSGFPQKVSDHGDIGVEDLRRAGSLHVIDRLHIGERIRWRRLCRGLL